MDGEKKDCPDRPSSLIKKASAPRLPGVDARAVSPFEAFEGLRSGLKVSLYLISRLEIVFVFPERLRKWHAQTSGISPDMGPRIPELL
jgi:hypothetical protein